LNKKIILLSSISVFLAITIVFGSILSAEATFPGKNGKIVFVSTANGAGDIYTMDPNGTNLQRLTTNPLVDFSPRWFSDGTKICYSSVTSGFISSDIYIMNADGSEKTRVTNDGWNNDQCSPSPDGTKIAYEREDREIFVININGTGGINLSDDDNNNDGFPTWSPDGTKIAWVKNDFSNTEIWTMNVDGSNQQNISNSPERNQFPDWSPDGNQILYRTDGLELYVMNADGSNQHPIQPNPVFAAEGSFSPDGNNLVYYNTVSQPEIFVSNADGSNETRITFNSFF